MGANLAPAPVLPMGVNLHQVSLGDRAWCGRTDIHTECVTERLKIHLMGSKKSEKGRLFRALCADIREHARKLRVMSPGPGKPGRWGTILVLKILVSGFVQALKMCVAVTNRSYLLPIDSNYLEYLGAQDPNCPTPGVGDKGTDASCGCIKTLGCDGCPPCDPPLFQTFWGASYPGELLPLINFSPGDILPVYGL